jgi:TorA maturation chaperone TorD
MLRARKFRALATLFTMDVVSYEEAIEVLLKPCPTAFDCPVVRGSVRAAASEALAWLQDVSSIEGLYDEHVRLFGGDDPRRPMPEVAASGGLYAKGGPQQSDTELALTYALHGFTPQSGDRCPSYIANELEFTAYLLERSLAGQEEAAQVAEDFLVSQLYTWGIVFAAATHARSSHPVTRLASIMLEHMLFCTTRHGRSIDERARAALRARAEPT